MYLFSSVFKLSYYGINQYDLTIFECKMGAFDKATLVHSLLVSKIKFVARIIVVNNEEEGTNLIQP